MRYYEQDDTRREDDVRHFRELKLREQRRQKGDEEDTFPMVSFWYQD